MKNQILLLTLTLVFGACSTQKIITTTEVDIDGVWTMTSFSAFSPDIPDFEPGEIIWTIDLSSSMVNVRKKHPKKHAFLGPEPGEHFARKNAALIRIGEDLYLYSLRNGALILDRNIDPMISNDLPMITFKRMKSN